MAKMIFEVTCVSEKENDAGVHVVLHGSTDTKESFKGPAPNSTLSLWPKGEAAASFKVGKKYELVEVRPVPAVVPAPVTVSPAAQVKKVE